MKTETVDAITAASQKATIGGSIMALFGGITATELAAVGGLVLACAGFLVNLYFQWREDRRKSDLLSWAEQQPGARVVPDNELMIPWSAANG